MCSGGGVVDGGGGGETRASTHNCPWKHVTCTGLSRNRSCLSPEKSLMCFDLNGTIRMFVLKL